MDDNYFVALILILGTGKLPGAAKKLGKVVGEYNKAKMRFNTKSKMHQSKHLQYEDQLELKEKN